MRKAKWFLLFALLACSGAGTYATLRPKRDPYAELKPFIKKDMTSYYQYGELRDFLGTVGIRVPIPVQDVGVREITAEGVRLGDLRRMLEDLASRKGWILDRSNTYSWVLKQPGSPDLSERIKVGFQGLGAPPERFADTRVGVYFHDVQYLSTWDKMRIGVQNRGRIPYKHPALEIK